MVRPEAGRGPPRLVRGGSEWPATVVTASVPETKRLYDVGQDQTSAFGLDCETIWLGTFIGFSGGSMLSPFDSEMDRLPLETLEQLKAAIEFPYPR